MTEETVEDKPSSSRIRKRQNTTLTQLEVINQGLERKVEELTKENEWIKKRIEVQNGEIQELKKKALLKVDVDI